ncbi:hypothetical protein PUN28_015740 [Cardiocondyla obscurior]|uniref:Uncharacterized protein n=1 Tax=Cardiocondyla obscurior TaxID=286306 RepID=A0AAW2EY16_9HYME
MTDRPKRNNIAKPRRYQTTSSEETEEIADSARKTSMGQQKCQLDEDVADLQAVLENEPPNMNAYLHQTQTYTQLPIINTSHGTTHSFCKQPFTQTSQTLSPTFTSHAPTYTQLLNINHTTQTHSNNTSQQLHYKPQNHNTEQTFTHDPHRKIYQKLNQIFQHIYNITNKSQKHTPEKPAFLPITSTANVDKFENASNEEYTTLVNYLIFISGFNAKESINLYAVCKNKNFEKPMRATFQTFIRDAVRAAKQRYLNKIHNNSHRTQRSNKEKKAHNMWNDEHYEHSEHSEHEKNEDDSTFRRNRSKLGQFCKNVHISLYTFYLTFSSAFK